MTKDAEISKGSVHALAEKLKSAPASQSRTYLPINLPLSFPTPLHLVNVLTNMHIIAAIFTHPSHAAFFADTKTDPKDTAVMGVMGLYISSSEDWSAENLLGTAAWKAGRLNEALIAEVFRIETTMEHEHETMKGIRVGGRWDPGAKLVEDLASFFKKAPAMLGKLKGVCGWVEQIVDQAWAEGDDEAKFVRNWCRWAVSVCPVLADSYRLPKKFDALPFSPLQLLHSLATRQKESNDLDLKLVSLDVVETISPLPLSIPTLLSSGVLVVSSDQLELQASVEKYKDVAVPSGTRTVQVDAETYEHYKIQSVEASRAVYDATASGPGRGLNYFDAYLASIAIERQREEAGSILYIVPLPVM